MPQEAKDWSAQMFQEPLGTLACMYRAVLLDGLDSSDVMHCAVVNRKG